MKKTPSTTESEALSSVDTITIFNHFNQKIIVDFSWRSSHTVSQQPFIQTWPKFVVQNHYNFK
jgi:hypothetical protein